MTTRITNQTISSRAFIDFPARIGTGTSTSGLEKINTFLADRWLELRIAANMIYRSFSFNVTHLQLHVEQIQTYKSAVEQLNDTDETKAMYVSAEEAISVAARAHFVHDPKTFMANNATLSQEQKAQIVHESAFLLCILKMIVAVKEFFGGKAPGPIIQPAQPNQPMLPQDPLFYFENPTAPDPVKPGGPKLEQGTHQAITTDSIWEALQYKPKDPKIGEQPVVKSAQQDTAILSEPDTIFLFELSSYPAVEKREKQIYAMTAFIPTDEAVSDVAKEIGEECPENIAKFKEKYQCGTLQNGIPMKLPTFHEGVMTEDRQDVEVMKNQLKKEEDPFKPEEIRKKCALCNERLDEATVKIDLALQREIASELEVLLSELTNDQIIKRLKKLIRVELAEDITTTRSVSDDPFSVADDIVIHTHRRTNAEVLKILGALFKDLPEQVNGKTLRDNIIWLLYAHCGEI